MEAQAKAQICWIGQQNGATYAYGLVCPDVKVERGIINHHALYQDFNEMAASTQDAVTTQHGNINVLIAMHERGDLGPLEPGTSTMKASMEWTCETPDSNLVPLTAHTYIYTDDGPVKVEEYIPILPTYRSDFQMSSLPGD